MGYTMEVGLAVVFLHSRHTKESRTMSVERNDSPSSQSHSLEIRSVYPAAVYWNVVGSQAGWLVL